MPPKDLPPQQARIINNAPDAYVNGLVQQSPELSDLMTGSGREASALVLHAENLPGIKLAPNSTLFFFRDPGADISRLSKEEGIRTLQERGVSIQGDTVRIISTLSTGRNFETAPDIVTIKSKAVADAVEGALDRALKNGISPQEAVKLEALRQEIARRGRDGTFNNNDDIVAIQATANKIAPATGPSGPRTGEPRQGGNGRG